MVDKISCAQRIRQGLTLRGMTQKDLCDKTGIPKSAMSQYCSGAFTPKQERTALIAQALNVNEAWLMGYDVPMARALIPQQLLDPSNSSPEKILDAQMYYAELMRDRAEQTQTLVEGSPGGISAAMTEEGYSVVYRVDCKTEEIQKSFLNLFLQLHMIDSEGRALEKVIDSISAISKNLLLLNDSSLELSVDFTDMLVRKEKNIADDPRCRDMWYQAFGATDSE